MITLSIPYELVTGVIGLVVGYLIRWVFGKPKRIGLPEPPYIPRRLDGEPMWDEPGVIPKMRIPPPPPPPASRVIREGREPDKSRPRPNTNRAERG